MKEESDEIKNILVGLNKFMTKCISNLCHKNVDG